MFAQWFYVGPRLPAAGSGLRRPTACGSICGRAVDEIAAAGDNIRDSVDIVLMIKIASK